MQLEREGSSCARRVIGRHLPEIEGAAPPLAVSVIPNCVKRGTPKKVVHHPQDIVRRPTTIEQRPVHGCAGVIILEDLQGLL